MGQKNRSRNRCWISILALAFLLLLVPGRAMPEPLVYTFNFDPDKIRHETIAGYDAVRYGDLDLSFTAGFPQLPMQSVHLAVPAGAIITAIEVTVENASALPGEFVLYPCQPPARLSDPRVNFVPPDPIAYADPAAYPAKPAELLRQGRFSDYPIASLRLYPLQYLPAEKQLIFNPKITVRLRCPPQSPGRLATRSPRSESENSQMRQLLKDLVVNPESLSAAPLARSDRRPRDGSRDDETHQYVIITGQALVSSFQPLMAWKRRKGLSATIVTVEAIQAEYSGADTPERIRGFIQYAHANWNTQWVLLGGDTDIVPHRTAFAMDCEYGAYENNYIPCDLYYADLDGDWNANGNDIHGEVADDIDMYPDIFVGRAPVETVEEAERFVSRLLSYERDPPPDYLLDMLFLAEILWSSPYTDSGKGKDHIADSFVPRRFKPITRLYESLGNQSKATVTAELNAGAHLINHDGHAFTGLLSIGNDYLRSGDMDALSNGQRYGIWYSIGCWPAAFDRDCIAEHFVTAPNGGGVAFIGNSRYGWGSPGNPLYGYSDRFDQQFFNKLLKQGEHHIGAALAAAKAVYVPFSAQENVYRWCQYEITLLGDPEMPVWTDTPAELTVDYPPAIPQAKQTVAIQVTDGYDEPLEGATVCLCQETALYETALTGADGLARLSVTGADPGAPVQVTVTAPNFIPFEGRLSLIAQGPLVQVAAVASADFGSDRVLPGKTGAIDLTLRNSGDTRAGGTWLRVRLPDGSAAEIAAGDISPGQENTIANAFSVAVPADMDNGDPLSLPVDIVADGPGHLWSDRIVLTAATPVLSADDCRITGLGDETTAIRPGDTAGFRFSLHNSGLAPADRVTVTVKQKSPADTQYLEFSPATLTLGSLLPGEKRPMVIPVTVSANTPVPAAIAITVTLETGAGERFTEQAVLPVGETGFFDDMDKGDGSWQHEGPGDHWHRTPFRRHSGAYSWYCGDAGSRLYANNAESVLETGPVILGPDARLGFWCWYEFPNYGTDGFYVEVAADGPWEVLDFIGSGGALPTLPTGNHWLPYQYDLSGYSAGTPLHIRFRFVSDDAEAEEGVYIDELRISPQRTPPDLGMVISVLQVLTGVEVANPPDPNANGLTDLKDAILLLRYFADPQPMAP